MTKANFQVYFWLSVTCETDCHLLHAQIWLLGKVAENMRTENPEKSPDQYTDNGSESWELQAQKVICIFGSLFVHIFVYLLLNK